MIQKSYEGNDGILYLIPTPIGNLDDITVRALKILKQSDFILCEDTRVTGLLLKKYEISKKLVRCDEYSQEKVKNVVLNALADKKTIGLVSDAGSPIISDPGYIVSKYVIENGYKVVALPGATAFVPALSVSGVSPSPFTFIGFLNAKDGKRKKELENLKLKSETLIFYESPHRLLDTLQDMLEIFGDRKIAICRELSKKFEEIIRGNISECLSDIVNVKGEIVIIVSGNSSSVDFESIDLISHVQLYINDGLSEMDSIKRVAKDRGLAKSIVYKEYIANKNNLE